LSQEKPRKTSTVRWLSLKMLKLFAPRPLAAVMQPSTTAG
jgi:hypothetical protein